MWHKIEPERMGCECTGWAYHWWGAGEGINRWWGKKKMSLSTRRLSFSKENVGNVKHSGVFTHLPVIQIFRLRLGPAVRQIPANPRGVVWPNLPQSMWPRLESKGGEKKGREMCVCIRVCFAFQAADAVRQRLMQLHFKWLFLWPPDHHLEETVSQGIFSRPSKLRHVFFPLIKSASESSQMEHQQRRH